MMDRGWTGVVLAGGRSNRMGRDKALIEVDGRTLLEHAIERLRAHTREILVIGDPAKYGMYWDHVIADDILERGPLGGITTALKHARYVRLIVTACDMPALNDRLVVRLKQAMDMGGDVVVPRHGDSIEPLAAAYHRRCIEPFMASIAHGALRMTDALKKVDTRSLDVTPGEQGWAADMFRNLNSPTDL